MAKTPHLKLPYIAPAQAQKHVTVNESLAELDGLVHCAVAGMGLETPPAGGGEGDRYLLGAAPTGVWAGKPGQVAQWRNGGWVFSAPRPGWRVYDLAGDALYVMNGAGAWTPIGGGAPTQIQEATRVGIGMTADAANPFAARLNAALWTARTAAEGGSGNVILAVNKASADRDAGFALQNNFVTRAIVGLFGSNRFRIAVSPDGAGFRDALDIDGATGIVDQPRLPRFKAHANFDVYAAQDVWTKIGVNAAEANEQGVFDPATSLFKAPASGAYVLGASLVFRQNASNSARMRGRLVRNGTGQIRGSFGECSSSHVTGATGLWLQTLAQLDKDDTVELQGFFRQADGFFAADQTTFWGFKVG